MISTGDYVFGLYEKALPDDLDWPGKFRAARDAGYAFIEISVDESDERLSRLDWSAHRRAELAREQTASGMRILSMCLSGLRRYPLGSSRQTLRERAISIVCKAVDFAADTGIRIVQIAPYDAAPDEKSTGETRAVFRRNLTDAVGYAAGRGVTLAIENITGTPWDDLKRARELVDLIGSPYLQLYPDFGNLDASNRDIATELRGAADRIVGIHVKDTREGEIRRIPFGAGRVDFVATFRAIMEIGYRGPLLIEMWADDKPDWERDIRDALSWVREKIKAAGRT